MRTLISIALAAGLAACSSTGGVVDTVDRPVEVVPSDTVSAESFDITPYRDEPADVDVDLEHDVPAALMENRADAGIEITVDGYRVQLFSTLDQEEAAEAEDAARAFWQELVESGAEPSDLPAELPVYRLFRQPYYRIRAGDFTDRDQAERVALLLAARFEGALVVPDMVTYVKQ